MQTRIGRGLALAAIGAAIAGFAPRVAADEGTSRVIHADSVKVTATVEAIDLPNRTVTLKDKNGVLTDLQVGEEVRNLAQVKKGDQVTVEYYIGIAGELRPPTEEEKAQPYVVLDDEARTPKGEAPAGAVVRTVRVVATVESLDLPSQTVTLKGPKGRYLTVRVDDPSKLSKAKLGDTVVVVAAEGLAISVEKTKTK